MSGTEALHDLGWRTFFQSQVDPDSALRPGRVMHVHRGRIEVAHEGGTEPVAVSGKAAGLGVTVGDEVIGLHVYTGVPPLGMFTLSPMATHRRAGFLSMVEAVLGVALEVGADLE